MPQVLVRVARVVLHAHRRARHQRKLREELRPGEAAGFGNLPQQTRRYVAVMAMEVTPHVLTQALHS